MNTDAKIIAGSEEWCAFTSLGIPAIKARVDSGAKTSSIHAFNIQKFTRGTENWVSFEVHPLQNNRSIIVRCERPVLDKRTVKSSSGVPEIRFVISATICTGGSSWDIELTLTNRDTMGYRMLLGREAMQDRLLVDPSSSFILGVVTNSEIKEYYGNYIQSKTGLKIGLLANNLNLYSNQRILAAGEEHGHEMLFLNIKQCYLKLDIGTAEIHHRDDNILSDLDAVITRIRPGATFYGCALARHFESMGVYTLNSSSAINQSRDKIFALQIMIKHDLNIPASGFLKSVGDIDDLIKMVGGAPLIIKDLENFQERGVILAQTTQAAEKVITAFNNRKLNLLVQKFIPEAEGKDLRCFVIGNRVIATVQYETNTNLSGSNLQRSSAASVIKITPEEKKLAIKAAKALRLKVAGIDIIRSNNGPLLLDVNSSPDLKKIESLTGKDIAGMMISTIEKKLGWKKEILHFEQS